MLIQNGQLVIGNRTFTRVDSVNEHGAVPAFFFSSSLIPESEVKLLIQRVNTQENPFKRDSLDKIRRLMNDETPGGELDGLDREALIEKIKEILES